MNTFTASNGGSVERLTSGRYTVTDVTRERLNEIATVLGRTVYLEPGHIDALREFFRAEEDKRLGRWRWPETPDYVVYPDSARKYITQPAVIVVNETDGATSYCGRTGMYQASGAGAEDELIEAAARAYFDAHPEQKPWHNADVDEAWELTANGDTGPFVTKLTPSGAVHFLAGNGTTFIVESPEITAGRRIYPEVAS